MNLFFAYPLPMSQSPTFTGGWAKILLQLMNQVEQAGIGPNKLVFGSRFKTLLTENPGEDRSLPLMKIVFTGKSRKDQKTVIH